MKKRDTDKPKKIRNAKVKGDTIRHRWMSDVPTPFFILPKLLLTPILSRKGSTVSPTGVTLHKFIGAERTLPWTDVADVQTKKSFNRGHYIELALTSGETVALAAPTSNTTRDFAIALQDLTSRWQTAIGSTRAIA